MSKKKFLFVSAEKGDLKLTGEEHKIIRELFPDNHPCIHAIREAYVTFSDLFNLFENNRTNNQNADVEILHFAGHSGPDGLLFDANMAGDGLISIGKFKEFISWYPHLKVIILNSCTSKFVGEQLKTIEHLDVIIETTDTVYERDAILFTEHFYGFLNKGDDILVAFRKVKLMFEEGTISMQERGQKREIKNRELVNTKFPWQIVIQENIKWKICEKVKLPMLRLTELKKELRRLMALGDAKKAMELLLENLEEDSTHTTTIYLRLANLNSLENDIARGIAGNIAQQKAGINHALDFVIRNLEEEDLSK